MPDGLPPASGEERSDGWVPEFPGQRPPFELGNQVATTHGAKSILRLEPRAAALAEELAELVPASSPSDAPTIRLLAMVLARIEAAHVWLAEQPLGIFRNGEGELQPVLKALSTWENTAGRLLERLGMTPTSRARLGLDLSRTGDELQRYLAERAASGGDA